MENNLESKLKTLGEKVILSQAERDFHKKELLKFMKKGAPEAEPVLSPFQFIFPRTKMLVAGFAFLLFFSTGLVSSAKSALPNQYLYVFRIKVVEPTQVFLAWGTKDRSATRIALIQDRLEDWSKVTLQDKVTPEAEALFSDAFSTNIKEVQDEIQKLAEEDSVSEALSTANDLQSVLAAHTVVLEKVQESGKEEPELAQMMLEVSSQNNLSSNLSEGLDTTNKIIENLTEKLETSEDDSELEEALLGQKNEAAKSLEEVANLEAEVKIKKNLSPEDEKYVNEKTEEIKGILKDAEDKINSGNKTEALTIYNRADQKIGELKTLLQSKENLGIDVLGESEIEGSLETQSVVGQ